MRLPRMTTRRWMSVIAFFALSLWLGLVASRVGTDPRGKWVFHLWERHGSIEPGSVFNSQHPVPFWPRYWRALLGQPWPDSYVCDEGCTRTWDRVGRIVVTVSYDPKARTKTTPDGRIYPSDPIAVSDRELNRLIEAREKRKQ
jgi:hypothetical protein